jgi:RNA polymerase sigma-54 factor
LRIKTRIRQLIEGENLKEPLSDQKIADLLTGENLALARRTVAKYREQMKVLPARMRLRYE